MFSCMFCSSCVYIKQTIVKNVGKTELFILLCISMFYSSVNLWYLINKKNACQTYKNAIKHNSLQTVYSEHSRILQLGQKAKLKRKWWHLSSWDQGLVIKWNTKTRNCAMSEQLCKIYRKIVETKSVIPKHTYIGLLTFLA